MERCNSISLPTVNFKLQNKDRLTVDINAVSLTIKL